MIRHTKPIRTHHFIISLIALSTAGWVTHSLTKQIELSPNWNQNALHRFFPESSEHYQPSQFSANVEDSSELNVFAPITLSDAVISSSYANDEVAEPAQKFKQVVEYQIKRGDTLGKIFKKQGFDLSLPFKISKHETAQDLVKLNVGKTLVFKTDATDQLAQVEYRITDLENIIVTFEADKLISAVRIPLAYNISQQSRSGIITSSLYETALEQGISIGHIMDMVRIFGWDIDFVLDIRRGDSFHMIYEDFILDGNKIADGALLAAEFTTQGETYRAIRFQNEDGEASYFSPSGESMLGTFLRSPVEFSRISSKFGQRKHPILKTWRAHKGVDYAAPRGTPIRATADGKVIHAGTKGGYGNTVILSHAGRFSTLYAHMTGFAKNIKRGSRVTQGQVIGYIGSSGLATGPHLHYEFRLDGVHRNPLTYKTPKATAVAEDLMPQFDLVANDFGAQLDQLVAASEVKRGAENLGAE